MGFYIQNEYWEAVEDLSDKEQDAFFGACVRQFFRGETEEPKPKNARRVFMVTKGRIGTARKRSASANARWDANDHAMHHALHGDLDDANEDANPYAKADANLLKSERESKSKNIFTPPTREEAAAYLASVDLTADLEKIFDHYESNGWKVGRNPMKDWKAAFRRAARDWAKGGDDGGLGEYASAF